MGKGVFKIRYAVLIGVLLITPPAYVAQGMNHFLYGNSAVGGAKGTQVYEDDQKGILGGEGFLEESRWV